MLKIEKSLKVDGIFLSVWSLPKNTTVSIGRWEKENIERVLEKTTLSIVSEREILIEKSKDLAGNEGVTHHLELVLKKE